MRQYKEIWVGAFLSVLLGGVLLAVHGRSMRNVSDGQFHLHAQFAKADGLMNGAEVRLAGIRVGEVTNQQLVDFQVDTTLSFDRPVSIPVDSSASIETDGLLGSKHVEITCGGDEEILVSGDTIEYTQNALILSELLDKVNAFMKDKKDKEAAEKSDAKSAIKKEINK